MKLIVERAPLLAALTRAARVIERRSTIPVLGNALLRAEDGALRLRATDLDLDLQDSVPAEVAAAGAATVPGHMLTDIVRKLPEGCQVSLALEGERMVVKAGRSRFQLSTLPVEDWPDISTGDLPHGFSVSAKDLKGIIDRAQFAISTEETRYYLNGIFLHVVGDGEGKALRGVATDGHRLAQVTLAPGSGDAAMPGVIVPRKTVVEMTRLLAELPGDVAVALSEAKIRFTLGGLTLTSKLIDGTFPDYNRVVPTANSIEVVADREELVKAVDRVATVASERGRAVKLTLAGRSLTLAVTSLDTGGQAVEELEVEAEAGAAIEIGFNSKYLLEILGHVAGVTVAIHLENAGSPALIKDVTPSGALFVLMPMRV